MVNDSYFRFDDDNKIKYTFSRSSQENWVSWRHTAPYSEYKDNWENCLNLRHTLGIIYLTSILVVQCFQISLHNKCNFKMWCKLYMPENMEISTTSLDEYVLQWFIEVKIITPRTEVSSIKLSWFQCYNNGYSSNIDSTIWDYNVGLISTTKHQTFHPVKT